MNKKKAKELAYAGFITYGQLNDLISNSDPTQECKINKNITRHDCLSIMKAAIKNKNPNEMPVTTLFNNRGKLSLTKDGITVMNILIECG